MRFRFFQKKKVAVRCFFYRQKLSTHIKLSYKLQPKDPISVSFVRCMDKLSHLVCEAIDDSVWKAPKAGKNGPIISHHMFADDLLLFGHATSRQMQ